MSDQNLKKLYATQLGLSRPTYTLWPAQTGAAVAGIVLTPGAGAWGAYNDIIAAAAIGTEFWLTQVVFGTGAGAFGLHEVQIFNATEGRMVYECRVSFTAATINLTAFDIPIPVWCNPGAQIQGRSGAANAADTITASLLVATGL